MAASHQYAPSFSEILELVSWALGNKITAAQVVGGLLVFAGVYVTTRMKGKAIKAI